MVFCDVARTWISIFAILYTVHTVIIQLDIFATEFKLAPLTNLVFSIDGWIDVRVKSLVMGPTEQKGIMMGIIR